MLGYALEPLLFPNPPSRRANVQIALVRVPRDDRPRCDEGASPDYDATNNESARSD